MENIRNGIKFKVSWIIKDIIQGKNSGKLLVKDDYIDFINNYPIDKLNKSGKCLKSDDLSYDDYLFMEYLIHMTSIISIDVLRLSKKLIVSKSDDSILVNLLGRNIMQTSFARDLGYNYSMISEEYTLADVIRVMDRYLGFPSIKIILSIRNLFDQI